MSDWPPVVDAEKSELKSLDNLNLARKRPWRGCVGSNGQLFSDGAILLHMRYLAKKSLAKELKEKTDNDRSVGSETMEEFWESLDTDRYVAKTRGYISNHPHAYGVAEHLAVVSWKNYQNHWSTDAKRLKLVRHLVGDSKAYTGEDAVMVFEKPSGNIAAALKLFELPIELRDS